MPRKRYTASQARLIALNSICATACTKAARPSGVPRPRCGTWRALTSCGFAGRPGAPMGSGDGAAGSGRNSPDCTATHTAWVRPSFSAGSVAARQAWAAAWRFVMESFASTRPSPRPSPRRGEGEHISSRAAPRSLGVVRAQHLDLLQVVLVEAGDVLAVEARGVEVLQRFVAVLHRPDQVLEILVDQPVGAEHLLHLGFGLAGGDQFGDRRHVDAVDVGVAHRRRGGGE